MSLSVAGVEVVESWWYGWLEAGGGIESLGGVVIAALRDASEFGWLVLGDHDEPGQWLSGMAKLRRVAKRRRDCCRHVVLVGLLDEFAIPYDVFDDAGQVVRGSG